VDDVRRARVAAQLLHRPRRVSVPDLVRRLLAVQAQDIAATPLALRARSPGLAAADVAAARADASVVRTWGPRGTLHLIAPDDLAWLLPLTVATSVTQAMTRLRQEGVTGSTEDLVRIAGRALAGRGPLTKAAFAARLATLGCPATGQGIVYMAYLAALHGLAVLGPDQGNKPTYVHTADWLGAPLAFEQDRDRGLAELARRYLRAHAPAAPEDLAAWAKVPMRDATKAFSLAADDLVAKGPLWTLRRSAARAVTTGVVLVPAFDEYLLGWKDRSFALPAEYAKRIAPGGGIIHPAILDDGVVIGTWRRTGTEPFQDTDAEALRRETQDLVRFAAS
jgi:Winged helix DNA-binding domain